MRVYIPADSDEAINVGFDLGSMLDGVRLSELEALDKLMPPDAMTSLLMGDVTVPALRPLAWVRLRRDRPDLTIEGFDLEVLELDDAGAVPAGKE